MDVTNIKCLQTKGILFHVKFQLMSDVHKSNQNVLSIMALLIQDLQQHVQKERLCKVQSVLICLLLNLELLQQDVHQERCCKVHNVLMIQQTHLLQLNLLIQSHQLELIVQEESTQVLMVYTVFLINQRHQLIQ